MDAGVLFSGGKDSTLAALLLERFYDVTLVCGTFGVTDAHKHARRTARALGFPFKTADLDPEVAEAAVAQIHADGYPREGIQRVHEHALEVVAAAEYDAIADGTRRDDRVPTVAHATAQSIEDRHDVDYIAPLSGFGRGAIDRLAQGTLKVAVGPSKRLPKGDYEAELRALLAAERGDGAVADVFPDHEQTRVVGLR